MPETFVSPQTGSTYIVAAKSPGGNLLVAYRDLGNGTYRVRLQGKGDALEYARQILPPCWGSLKSSDHYSIVVAAKNLAAAAAHAVQAIITADPA